MMARLTDNDIVFGPITVGKTDWNGFYIMFNSSDNLGENINIKSNLTIYAFNYAFRLLLGNLIKANTYKVKASWDEETIKRLGRDFYPEYLSKQYGFVISDNHVIIRYGQQRDYSMYTHYNKDKFLSYKTNEINKEYTKLENRVCSFSLPWGINRMTEYSIFDTNMNVIYSISDNNGLKYKDYSDQELKAPSLFYKLRDCDGEIVIAGVKIKETVYRTGQGKFKWLSWFTKAAKNRRAEITFDRETGKSKGTWKGGTLSTSILISPTENHTDAIRNYCHSVHSSREGDYTLELLSNQPLTIAFD